MSDWKKIKKDINRRSVRERRSSIVRSKLTIRRLFVSLMMLDLMSIWVLPFIGAMSSQLEIAAIGTAVFLVVSTLAVAMRMGYLETEYRPDGRHKRAGRGGWE